MADDFTICNLDALATCAQQGFIIVRCDSEAPPGCPISLTPERIVAECFSLTAAEGVSSPVPVLPPPLPRPFLDVVSLAPEIHLREAARLWGLVPDEAVRAGWKSFMELADTPVHGEAPKWAKKLVQRKIAIWDGEAVYLPLAVFAAFSSPQPTRESQGLERSLQWVRRYLAMQAAEIQDSTPFRSFARFLAAPQCDPNELLLYRCLDLPALSSGQAEPGPWVVSAARAFCVSFSQEQPDTYREVWNSQRPIWEAFGDALQGLVTTLKAVGSLKPLAQEGDYDISCQGARSALEPLAKAFFYLGRFERRMGVDRYMAPALIKSDLDSLHDLVREIRRRVNQGTERHRRLFQRDWGNHRVADIVRRLFNQTSSDPFTSRFPTGQRRVILLVVDGFGYVQYRWNQLMAKDRRQTTFGGSVLDFLSEQPEYVDDWVLGGPLVTDTGAGLSQIFSGLPSRENGIYSSQHHDASGFFDVKRIQTQEEWNRRVGGDFPLTFFDTLEKVKVQVLASGAGSKPNPFSQRNYGEHPVEPVEPPERFSQVLLEHMEKPDSRRQLYVVYYPLIDRHGHSLGSFSSFELHEYERFNQMLSSFLLQLLSSRPDLFDGQTTLMLTADHGMFESSGGSITQDEILAKLETAGLRRPRVTIANRAVFLHGVRPGELHATENALKALFKAKAMDAQFIAQTHTTYQELISDRESPPPGLPDLFILLRDEGLAVTRPIAAPMLHYGGHGGCSAEEVFVPCVTVVLTPNLSAALTERYGRLA